MKTTLKYQLVWLALFSSTLFNIDALQPEPRIDLNPSKLSKSEQMSSYNTIKGAGSYSPTQDRENDIDYRIVIVEPYKSLVQTTARFALAQTPISNHVPIETAMDLINDAGFMLSKPSNLIKLVKVAAIGIASILTTTFIYPGAYKLLDSFWQDPSQALNLNRFLSNGVIEKSVLGMLNLKSGDDFLSRLGFNDSSCREKSVCYIGEALNYAFPGVAEDVNKFVGEKLSATSYKENRYVRAFLSGFVDRNCTKINSSSDSSNGSSSNHKCIGNLFGSIFQSRWGSDTGSNERLKSKYQTIHAKA